MRRGDAALLVLLGATWGAVYPLTAVVLREMHPAAIVFARTGLSALILVPLAARRGVLTSLRARPLAVLVAALSQATIPLLLVTTGQRHVSAGLAGILLATQPVWAAVLTACADRAVHARQLAGLLLGLGGVALLFARDLSTTGSSTLSGLIVLAAAIFYAAGTVWIERVIPGIPPLATATAAMTVSAIALAPVTVFDVARVPDLPTAGWLLLLGVAATGGALVVFYALIQRAGAVRANLAGYLAPAFAVAYGVLLLGERVTTATVAGLTLILAGSYTAARS